MFANKFMMCDASYSSQTKCAGLGVIDLSTGEEYTFSYDNIENTSKAELLGLIFSIKIALSKNYKNVVFIYDNKTLPIDMIEQWLAKKKGVYQFLWLKREYLKEVDKLAKQARVLREKLNIKTEHITDKKLVPVFKKYSHHQIIKSFMIMANKSEYTFLKDYISNLKHPTVLVKEESLQFFSNIYHLTAEQDQKKRFIKYIDKNYSGILDRQFFCQSKPHAYYATLIRDLLVKLKTRHKNYIPYEKFIVSSEECHNLTA